MTPDLEALARRAVACAEWRWMPGMLVVGSTRFGDWPFRICDLSRMNLRDDPGALPDLSDAATIGCVVAVVREAWREPSELWEGWVGIHRDHRQIFYAERFYHDAEGALKARTVGSGNSEIEAYIAALELRALWMI